MTELRPNIGLPPRLEGIEVVCTAGTDVYPSQSPEPSTIDPTGVVIHAVLISLLSAIDPQRQATIIRGRCAGAQITKVNAVRRRS